MRRPWIPILAAAALTALVDPGPGAAVKRPGGTNLLFTYVSNVSGFDTLLTIANTSFDTAGSTLVDGKCTLNFYGSTAPAPVETPTIAAGTTYVNSTSLIAPGFNGYMIAQCEFPLAHGFGALSDFGLRNLAAGYPALVIPSEHRKSAERLAE